MMLNLSSKFNLTCGKCRKKFTIQLIDAEADRLLQLVCYECRKYNYLKEKLKE